MRELVGLNVQVGRFAGMLLDELQAKFSMEFCMAILLHEGRGGLAEPDGGRALLVDGVGGGVRRPPSITPNAECESCSTPTNRRR